MFDRYHLSNYVSIHQGWKNGKIGGVITIFIHKEFIYNTRHDRSVNDEGTEALCLEIINQKSKNILLTLFTDSHLEIKKILKMILVSFS